MRAFSFHKKQFVGFAVSNSEHGLQAPRRNQKKCTSSDWSFSSLLLLWDIFFEAQAELWNYNNKYLNLWIIKISINKQDDSSQVVFDIPHFHEEGFWRSQTHETCRKISINLLVAKTCKLTSLVVRDISKVSGISSNFHQKKQGSSLGKPERILWRTQVREWFFCTLVPGSLFQSLFQLSTGSQHLRVSMLGCLISFPPRN